MSSQKVIVYLTALVAIGIIVVGLLATILHSSVLAPIPVIGLILAILVLLTNRGNFAHKIATLEKIMFFVTFLIIVCSFILLYKPI